MARGSPADDGSMAATTPKPPSSVPRVYETRHAEAAVAALVRGLRFQAASAAR